MFGRVAAADGLLAAPLRIGRAAGCATARDLALARPGALLVHGTGSRRRCTSTVRGRVPRFGPPAHDRPERNAAGPPASTYARSSRTAPSTAPPGGARAQEGPDRVGRRRADQCATPDSTESFTATGGDALHRCGPRERTRSAGDRSVHRLAPRIEVAPCAYGSSAPNPPQRPPRAADGSSAALRRGRPGELARRVPDLHGKAGSGYRWVRTAMTTRAGPGGVGRVGSAVIEHHTGRIVPASPPSRWASRRQSRERAREQPRLPRCSRPW